MKQSVLKPLAQLFVCTNQRRPDDPLRSGCGVTGPEVFAALKQRVIEGGIGSRVWITSTGCLGLCPRAGCTVSVYPANAHLVEVTKSDVDEVLRRALTPIR
jgi:(2Fe-2S) ferredoxin